MLKSSDVNRSEPQSSADHISPSICSKAPQKDHVSKDTPKKCFNPFDLGPDRLRSSYFSPNVFASKSGQQSNDEQTEEAFRWSIGQLSVLKPTYIDESSHQDDSHGTDSETEEMAQTAISEFFLKNKIVPSPWMSNSKAESLNTKAAHHVTFSPDLASTAYYDERYEDISNISKNSSDQSTTQSTWSQTVLSFPPNLDLGKTLSQFFTFTENQQKFKNEPEAPDDIKDLSACTLRRKLFDHDDQKDRDPRFEYKPSENLHPPLSPPITTPPRQSKLNEDKLQSTPDSSSPITPCYERNCNFSPALSPLAKSVFKTPSTGSLQNEGVFRIASTPSSCDFTPKKGILKSSDRSSTKSIMDDSSACFLSPNVNDFISQTNVTSQFQTLSTVSCSKKSRLHDTVNSDPMDYSDQNTRSEQDTGYCTQPLSMCDKSSADDPKCYVDEFCNVSRSSKVIKLSPDAELM